MSAAEENSVAEYNELSSAMETKIRMALAEATMENLDVKVLSLGAKAGFLSPVVLSWLEQSKGRHGGKLSTFFQDSGVKGVFDCHPKHQFSVLDGSIKIRDFREILVIGSNVAIFDADGRIYIQRGKEFIDAANRVIRSLAKITVLIEAKKK
jgi:hypothetical protein